MVKKFKDIFGKMLLNERPVLEAPTDWTPGLSLMNAVGDVDTTGFGYDYVIRTTSYLRSRSIQQKFYEVPPADFLTIEVGEGAWLETIVQNVEYSSAGDFESGIQNISGGTSTIPEVDVALNPITYPIVTWAKGYKYALAEVQKALAANNWDVVKAKTDALKKNWDLGIQKIAFLGSKSVSNVYGLYTLPNVTIDLITIPQSISTMQQDVFNTFIETILGVYYANTNYTVLPDTFVIPMDDMLGLASAVSAGFPVISKAEFLLDALKKTTGNPNFKLLATAYGMSTNNTGYISNGGKGRYVLYRNDPETVRMSIPAQFTLTSPGTADNYQWKGVGYGQYTGVQNYRVREVYYFDVAGV